MCSSIQMENEHCMLLALPCGRDHMDVLQQSTNLTGGFITYLQRKQAAGIVNVAPPGHHQVWHHNRKWWRVGRITINLHCKITKTCGFRLPVPSSRYQINYFQKQHFPDRISPLNLDLINLRGFNTFQSK